MRSRLAVLLAAAFCSACTGTVFGDQCDHSRDLEETIATEGVRQVTIEALAGSLRVTGLEGASQVVARGKACAGSASRLDEIELDVSRRGDTIAVEVVIPENRGWSSRNHASLDLAVSLPAELAVKANDSSGDLEIQGVSSLVLEDGSGNIDIANIAGDVEIVDGSGNLVIEKIAGNLAIEDGSGNIDVRTVHGTVLVDDGSGNVEIVDAEDITVREDGSGDMDFRDVRGNVRVEEDGSGNIRVAGIGGDVVVERDGSGGIDVTDVRGRVSTPDDK